MELMASNNNKEECLEVRLEVESWKCSYMSSRVVKLDGARQSLKQEVHLMNITSCNIQPLTHYSIIVVVSHCCYYYY